MTATAEAPEILLRHHLKKLKLPTVLREYEKLARQCAAESEPMERQWCERHWRTITCAT